jgi:hypothetical protein
LQRRNAKRAPKGSSGRKFFSKFTSPEQFYAATLSQDNQNQQPKAMQTERKVSDIPCCSICHSRNSSKEVCQYRLPESSNNTTVVTVVHQIMTELSEAMSQEDRVMVITKMVLNLMQENGC